MSDKQTVIVLSETVLESWARDAGTFAMLAGVCAVGWLLDSQALQWIGGIMAIISMISRAMGTHKRSRMTIAQARAKLDELEAYSRRSILDRN